MALIAVQPVPGGNPPRVDLIVNWSGVSTVTIRRRDPDGVARAVRGAEPATLASGVWSGSDFESWFDYGHIYEATSNTGAVITSDTAVLSPEAVWLRHPGIPSKSMVIDLAGSEDRVHGIGKAVLFPLGRTSPVVLTDGTRRTPSTTYKVRTWTLDERAGLLDLLTDGTVLLCDVPNNWGWGVTHEYWSIGDATETRLVDDDATFEGREWSLPIDTVERQAGALAALINYGTVMEGAATYTRWLELYSTYATLLANNATGSGTPPPSGGGGGGATIVNTGGQFSATTWGSNPGDYSQAVARTNDMAPSVYVVLTDLRANRYYGITASFSVNITGSGLSPSATSVTAKIVRAAGGVWVNYASAAKVTISQTLTSLGTQVTFSLSGTMTIPTDGSYLIGIALVITGGSQFKDATDASHPRSVVVTDLYYSGGGASGTNTGGDTNIEGTGGGGGGGGGSLPALSTYNALYSAYTTYQAVLNARATYTIVINGT